MRDSLMTMQRLAVSLISLLLIVSLSGCKEYTYTGVLRENPVAIGDLSLPDANGKSFKFEANKRGLLLVYFGFTFCPDICPTTLSDVRSAKESMTKKDADRLRLAFVTVDLARDTPVASDQFVKRFDSTHTALIPANTGQLDAATKPFGASYKITSTAKPSEPEVSHSTWLYGINSRGELLMQWSLNTPAKKLAGDFSHLLKNERLTP